MCDFVQEVDKADPADLYPILKELVRYSRNDDYWFEIASDKEVLKGFARILWDYWKEETIVINLIAIEKNVLLIIKFLQYATCLNGFDLNYFLEEFEFHQLAADWIMKSEKTLSSLGSSLSRSSNNDLILVHTDLISMGLWILGNLLLEANYHSSISKEK